MEVCAENEYFETLKPLLYMLKIFGILPFVLNNKETPCRKIITLMINLFSMIVYSIASGSSIIFIGNNVVNLMKHFNFVHFVRISTEITMRISVLIVPFAIWNKSNLFTEYYDEWKSIQNDLETMNDTPYIFSLKRRIRWVVYFIIIVLITCAILTIKRDREMKTSHSLSRLLVVSFADIILGYWYSNCIFFRQVIQIIHKHIEKTTTNEEVNDENLQKLVHMWTRVCDLIDRFNSIHSIIFLTQIISGVINCVSNYYSAVLWLIFRGNKKRILEELVFSAIGLSFTYLYCESANTVYNQLVHRTQTLLLNKNTSKMPIKYLETLRFFLNSIETRNPKIELNGTLKIDRSTFIVMMAAGVNYLIILMQFGNTYIQQSH